MKQRAIVLQGTATGNTFDSMRRQMREMGPGNMLALKVDPGEGPEIPDFCRGAFREKECLVVSAWAQRGMIDTNCAKRKPLPMLVTDPHAVITAEVRDVIMAYKRSGRLPPMVFVLETGFEGLQDSWGPRFYANVTEVSNDWPRIATRSLRNWEAIFRAACGQTAVSKEAISALGSCRSSLKHAPSFSAQRLVAMAQKAVAVATNNGRFDAVIESAHVIAAWALPVVTEASPET